MAFTDSLPDSLLGAALYTNPQQEGILQANIQPPSARDICEFKGCLFYANVSLPPRVIATLLSVGGAGLRTGDIFQMGGLNYAAGTVENINTGTFKLYTDGTPSQNVQSTAASIARVVNRRPDNSTHICFALLGTEDEPGKLIFQRLTYGVNVDWDPTSGPQPRATAWSPGTAQQGAGETQRNAIYWSKSRQPDAVPFLSFARLGSADKEILRIIPTRDSVFILKEDGVWRLSGDGPDTFRVDPVDTTLECVAPETALALDGTCFVLTEQGVVRITETGIVVVSRGIEPVIQPKIAQALRSTVKSTAFAVGYESDRKYMIWLPTAPGQDSNPEAYVYDLFTDSWVRRTDRFSCAILNPADDILYLGDGDTVYKERKTFVGANDNCDKSVAATIVGTDVSGDLVILSDASLVKAGDGIGQGGGEIPEKYAIVLKVSGNVLTMDRPLTASSPADFVPGSCLVFRAIPCATQWSPLYAQNPAALHHMREVSLIFREHTYSSASLHFSTNLVPAESTVTFNRADYGASFGVVKQQVLRTLVPKPHRRASQLNIRYEHRQARTNALIQAVSLIYNQGGKRVGM